MNIDIDKLRAAAKLRAATPSPQTFENSKPTPPDNALAWCIAQHEDHHGPLPTVGGRNQYVAALAYFANETGISLADLEAYAVSNYEAADFTAREIEQTLHGIYTREASAHGRKPFTSFEEWKNEANDSPHSAQKENAPTPLPDTFPAAVYEALPDYLQRCCAPFEGHEKAIMLLGTLAVLSGCFPAVGGIYNKRRFGLNLFAFIIAPAASGKGTLNWARRLAWPYHKALTDASRAARVEYDAELAAYRTAGKAKASLTAPPVAPPPYKMLFLPGNTTAAALQTALAENDGRGIICETEADTLTGALGADFGNFSDVLRKAFQHEPISLLRKTDRQHLDLARPALSIVLTGTPGQLPQLMPTAENGLVSRNLFYIYAQTPIWQDVSPSAGPALDPYIDALGQELTRMIAAAPEAPDEASTYPVEITLSPADWQRLNKAGAAGLDEALNEAGEAGGSSAFRLGLIAWRVMGLLTVLRCFENGQAPSGQLVAHPTDVGTALAIMDTARAHALAVLARLPAPIEKSTRKTHAKAQQREQVTALHAKGLSYRQISAATGVPFTTVRNWLKNL